MPPAAGVLVLLLAWVVACAPEPGPAGPVQPPASPTDPEVAALIERWKGANEDRCRTALPVLVEALSLEDAGCVVEAAGMLSDLGPDAEPAIPELLGALKVLDGDD